MSDTLHFPAPARTVWLAHFRSGGVWADQPVQATLSTFVAMPALYLWLLTDHPLLLEPVSIAFFTTFMAIVFPLRFWIVPPGGSSPGSYFFTAPVDRFANALIRFGAGYAWCLLVCVLFLLSVALMSHWAGDWIAGLRGLPATGPVESRALWQWLIPVSGATLGYLYSCVPLLGSRKPHLWFLGILLVGIAGHTFAFLVDRADITLLKVVFSRSSEIGLSRALRGEISTVSAGVVEHVPDLGGWLTATGFWMAVGVAGVLIAARRYREW